MYRFKKQILVRVPSLLGYTVYLERQGERQKHLGFDLQRRFSGGKNAFTTHLRTAVERDRNTERGRALDRLRSVKLLGCCIRNAVSTTLEFDGPIL